MVALVKLNSGQYFMLYDGGILRGTSEIVEEFMRDTGMTDSEIEIAFNTVTVAEANIFFKNAS